MELNKSIYIPITPFHLICSTILKNEFKHELNVLILLNDLFEDKVIEQIRKSNNWTTVITIRRTSKYFTSVKGLIYSQEIISLIDFKEYNVFYFSPGISICNFIVNILSKFNVIYLCDDGLAPYYFKNNIFNRWDKIANVPYYKDLFLKIVKKLTNRDFRFEQNNISHILLINSDLASLVDDNFFLLKIEDYRKEIALNEVSAYFVEFMPHLDHYFKIVYFHSGELEFDHKNYSYLLANFDSSEIFSCFRHRTPNKVLNQYKIHNNSVPWELIYFSFAKNFTGSLLISSYLTTAFISTVNPHSGYHKRFILDSNLLISNNGNFREIQRVINEYSISPLVVIDNIEELHSHEIS